MNRRKFMIPVIDGHLDSLQAMFLPDDNPRSLIEQTDRGHFDIPRARKGHFAGGLFAIFFPAEAKRRRNKTAFPGKEDAILKPVESAFAQEIAQKGIESFYGLAEQSSGRIQVAKSADEVSNNMAQGVISTILHFEGAEPIAPDLTNLPVYYQAGLRSLGIVWSRPNAFGAGVDFQFPGSPDTGPGLTEAGKELIIACNRLGIIIDLSHLNEKGFWDVERLSDAPLVATHSCMHALTPISRNLTDKQLEAIRDSKGVVGINFCTGFLRTDAKLTANTPISDIIRHTAYAVDKMGIDHVAIGSDFDGAVIPKEIGDVSGLPKLVEALFEHGFDEASVRKIACENWLRIFTPSWKTNA